MSTNFERTQAIVEELRADVDFELDDVIAKIVHGLPDDYFTSLDPADQLKPLKALLAMGICHLDDEIMMRSADGQKVAVVANKNYPGQLANILHRLPSENTLIGAKIFTSTDHDFIIDVFEFERDHDDDEAALSALALEHLIEEVALLANAPHDAIAEFVSHYHPCSPILNTAHHVAEQFMTFNSIEHSTDRAIRWTNEADQPQHPAATRITVSVGNLTARQLLQCTSEFFGQAALDIEQAWLQDIPLDHSGDSHVAVVSFLIEGQVPDDSASLNRYLDQNVS